MTRPSILCVQFDGGKVLDIVSVEKHVPDRSRLAVHLEGVSSQDDSLGNDSGGISVHKCSHGYQVRTCALRLTELVAVIQRSNDENGRTF